MHRQDTLWRHRHSATTCCCADATDPVRFNAAIEKEATPSCSVAATHTEIVGTRVDASPAVQFRTEGAANMDSSVRVRGLRAMVVLFACAGVTSGCIRTDTAPTSPSQTAVPN